MITIITFLLLVVVVVLLLLLSWYCLKKNHKTAAGLELHHKNYVKNVVPWTVPATPKLLCRVHQWSPDQHNDRPGH